MSSLYREVFPKLHTFLVVVHVEDREQTLHNIRIAMENGADGAFLISHGYVRAPELVSIYWEARKEFPSFWLGFNFLDKPNPIKALESIPAMCPVGLWSDDSAIGDTINGAIAEEFKRRQRELDWGGVYFGGVAFKHQESVIDVARAARNAVDLVDVVTTSGRATGQAPCHEKIRRMKEALGNYPLAIASGMTPENVRTFMPFADCFLVATGISVKYDETNFPYQEKFDPTRVRAFADAIA